MKETGHEPRNRRKTDAAHEVELGFQVWAGGEHVFLQLPPSLDHLRLRPEVAIEVGVALIKYARRAGLKEPLVWRAPEVVPGRGLNPNSREREDK